MGHPLNTLDELKELREAERCWKTNPSNQDVSTKYAFQLMDQIQRAIEQKLNPEVYLRALYSVKESLSVCWQAYCDSFVSFRSGRNKETVKNLTVWLKEGLKDGPLCPDEVFGFLETFTPYPPRFWSTLAVTLTEIWPNSAPGYLFHGMSYWLEVNDHEKALDAFAKALDKDPSYWLASLHIAEIHYDMKNWLSASKFYRRALESEIVQSFAYVYFDQAWCLGKAKRYKEEEESYRKCLNIDPDYEYATNNLGLALYRQGEYEEALALFNKCLERKIDGKYPVRNKVMTLRKLERYSEAIDLAKTCQWQGSLTKWAETQIKACEGALRRQGLGVLQLSSGLDGSDNSVEEEIDDLDIGEQEEAPPETRYTRPTSGPGAPSQANGMAVTEERILEELIEKHMQNGKPVFNRQLSVYETDKLYGRQLILPVVGRIDLLGIEQESGDLVVIELKRGKGSDEVIGQVQRYIGWVQENIAKEGQKVTGIICVREITDKLRYAAMASNIEVYSYDLLLSRAV